MSDQVALALIAAIPSTISAVGVLWYGRKVSLKVETIHTSMEHAKRLLFIEDSNGVCTRGDNHDGPCNGWSKETCKQGG